MKASIRVERDYGGKAIGHFVNVVYTDDKGEVKQAASFDKNLDIENSTHKGSPDHDVNPIIHEQTAEPTRAQFAAALRSLADQLEKP